MNQSTPDLTGGERRFEALTRASRDWPSWTLTARQLGDLELILSGAYAPLDRFMTHADAEACARDMRLGDGAPFPAPVRLDVSDACAAEARSAGHLVLRDAEGVAVAALEVRDAWNDGVHAVGGPVRSLRLPTQDRPGRALTPGDVADRIRHGGWQSARAFPTRGDIDRAEHRALCQALEADPGAGLVIIGLSDPDEDDARRLERTRCLEVVLPRFPSDRTMVWLLPLPRRMPPALDLLLASLVARNAGCTDLIATQQLDSGARAAVIEFARRIGLGAVHAPVESGAGTDTFPEVAEERAAWNPPQQRRGFTLFFTGLSGSGKSTIANLVRLKLIERARRPVTLLDGDLVRQHLSSELGFSREHRNLNIRRIAFVASEITRHGGIAICAPIAPYESVRQEARRAIEAVGGFVLVFVDTPIEVCEARDRKGLYAKARAGLVREFTGISDPYERPADAEVVVRTEQEAAHEAADRILAYLEQHGYVAPGGPP
jgi:sulfate adenylyltransferase